MASKPRDGKVGVAARRLRPVLAGLLVVAFFPAITLIALKFIPVRFMELVAAGTSFLDQLGRFVAALVGRDAKTGQAYLKLPIPSERAGEGVWAGALSPFTVEVLVPGERTTGYFYRPT